MRALLVGDTHANTRWLEQTVTRAAIAQDAELIIQLGDFGFWPGRPAGERFLDAARRSPIPLWWIDGNHEHHDALATEVARADDLEGGRGIALGGNLTYLPRGSRFALGGVSMFVCGGAQSIDRAYRKPGVDWFAAERISDDDVGRCAAEGHADIALTHDAPAGWRIPGLLDDNTLGAALRSELPACWSHRDQLERIIDVVTPQLLVHGHYHSGYARAVDRAWGAMQVVGLDCDGTAHSMALLDCDEGAWQITPIAVAP